MDGSPMKFDTTFYHEQAEPSARSGSYISPTVESLEQVRLIFAGDADPLVANNAYRVSSILFNRENDNRSGLRVLHRVAQKICENVAEQSFIRLYFWRNRGQRQFDWTASVCHRKNLIY